MPGRLDTALCRTALCGRRARIGIGKADPDPATLVTQLNSAMKESMPQSKFVTLFAARLDPATGIVEFANAGHNPPLFVGAAGVQPLNTTDIILGMFPNAQYRRQTLQLEPGDSLVLFTDGVTEASSDGEDEYGSARLEQLVKGLHGRPADVFTGEIERAVLGFVQDDHCADDVTMVVVTRKTPESVQTAPRDAVQLAG